MAFPGAGTVPFIPLSIRPGTHPFIWDILLFTADFITVTDSAMVIHHMIMHGMHIIHIPIGVTMVITAIMLPYAPVVRFLTIQATGADREVS